jgi:Ran GTPase-activating protein (RanGAP) involved in mRNA processing and transport
LLHAHQSELEVLQLDENRVSDEGMLAMAGLLERGWCGKLRELHLKNNFFQQGDTAMVIMEAFCASARRNGVTPQVLSLGVEENLLLGEGGGHHARRYSWG